MFLNHLQTALGLPEPFFRLHSTSSLSLLQSQTQTTWGGIPSSPDSFPIFSHGLLPLIKVENAALYFCWESCITLRKRVSLSGRVYHSQEKKRWWYSTAQTSVAQSTDMAMSIPNTRFSRVADLIPSWQLLYRRSRLTHLEIFNKFILTGRLTDPGEETEILGCDSGSSLAGATRSYIFSICTVRCPVSYCIFPLFSFRLWLFLPGACWGIQFTTRCLWSHSLW